MMKKTKIVATISDLRCDVDYIKALYEAGMNAVRINTAHASMEGAQKIIANTRAVSDQIAIIIDTKGPEIRVTGVEKESYPKGITVEKGDVVRVKGSGTKEISTAEMVYMNDTKLYDSVPVGARILIDDGDLEMVVIEKREKTLFCEVKNSGAIKSHKSVNIPGVRIDLPSVSKNDKLFIYWAIENKLDFIAHSFVRNKEDVLAVRSILDEHKSTIGIISKIENREGVNNIDEILGVSQGIMVARGDLGVEIPYEQIPATQRIIVRKSIESKTPVIIATQMLHTMINNPRATRAEVSDIAGAIYQKVDAIMLSGETTIGDYPVEAVTTMTKIAVEVEGDKTHYTPDTNMNLVRINNEVTAQLARSAVRATINLPIIEAVLIDTQSGRTGRYLSAFRGEKPIYAVCYRKEVMRQLALSYGVYAMYREPSHTHNSFLLNIFEYLEAKKRIKKEDLVVVVGGSFGVSKGASFVEIGDVQSLKQKALSKDVTCNKE